MFVIPSVGGILDLKTQILRRYTPQDDNIPKSYLSTNLITSKTILSLSTIPTVRMQWIIFPSSLALSNLG